MTALYEITPVGGPSSVDPLRYQREARLAGVGGELAFLRVRYKLPGQPDSRLMERPITDADAARSWASTPPSTRWAIAVATWGQKLRGDPWISDQVSWRQVADMAENRTLGGIEGEFPNLVRRAGELAPTATASRD